MTIMDGRAVSIMGLDTSNYNSTQASSLKFIGSSAGEGEGEVRD